MNHFQTFITLCECKNFSETAKLLYVPQPTISNRIHFMENAFKRELFIRGKKGVEMTKAGELFLPYARQIMDLLSQAISRLNETEGKHEIAIGSSVPFTLPLILEKILELSCEELEHNFILTSLYSYDIIQSLLDKDLDLAIAINPLNHKDIETHLIGKEDLTLFLSAHHPLRDQFEHHEPFSFIHDFIVYYQPYYELFRSHPLMNLNNKRKFITNNVGLIKKLLASRNAISFLPESQLQDEIKRGELAGIPIKNDLFALSISYYLMYRRNERYYEHILLHTK
ncbi:LysR family transcriptional regulator [Paenibacillus humicola]|uniref:LysR family transcriptional regulator n=1 Tax=Paenibacillus humicola TaxID=3110540 RepID=UPI00237AC51E|nr:LysR family transcriptional regulator [Paenibacillus humicola]